MANKDSTVEVPLKGRVWISTNSFDVLHVETDLRDPMKELELARDHISNRLRSGGIQEIHKPSCGSRGQRKYFWTCTATTTITANTLSNYALFDVATDNKISAPKNVPVENDDKPQTDPNQKPH